MPFTRSAFVFLAFVTCGPALLFACTGDDNSLPLPPDAGSVDGKAGDGGAKDGTTSKDASDKPPDAEGRATTDATTVDARPDVAVTPEASADVSTDTTADEADASIPADDGG